MVIGPTNTAAHTFAARPESGTCRPAAQSTGAVQACAATVGALAVTIGPSPSRCASHGATPIIPQVAATESAAERLCEEWIDHDAGDHGCGQATHTPPPPCHPLINERGRQHHACPQHGWHQSREHHEQPHNDERGNEAWASRQEHQEWVHAREHEGHVRS